MIGAGKRAWDLIWILRGQGEHLQYDVTFVHQESFGRIDPRLAADPARSGSSFDLGNLLDIANRVRADQIVVAPDERRGMALESLIICRTAGYPVLQYMSFLEKEVRPHRHQAAGSRPGCSIPKAFHFGPLGRGLKRMLDIVVEPGDPVPLSPFLLLPAMLAVWLEDRGPVFYRQDRVTQGGRTSRS